MLEIEVTSNRTNSDKFKAINIISQIIFKIGSWSFFMVFQKVSLFWDLFGILRTPPFVNLKGKDFNSDWLAGQWDERSVSAHARIRERN